MAIRNHVDKYVITEHYHLLMPLSLATKLWVRRPKKTGCNQEQIKYLRMFVMSHLEQTNVNMTNHGVQNERNLRTVQLMMLSVIIDIHIDIQI
ncbi:hypothetical protein T01_4529 [Trichinella spiralis]|uniref:Uncharacterized protein n=1 Tax=Trichinella spiralis TaxID=6334 RepID=A0A0V1BJK3_TRISP|nr:hypothetical protein T01_4529 [Trichinella spiralis]